MTDLILKRLVVEDGVSWAYWPILEARLRAALPALEPEAPADVVVRHFRTLWASQGPRVGAWLALRDVARTNGHVPAPRVVAHMLAYVDMYWNQPCILVYQLEGDPGQGALELLLPMMRELEAWREHLNAAYAAANSGHRIDLVRFYTTRPKAFRRWFKQTVEVDLGGTIVTFRLSQTSAPNPSPLLAEE